MFLWLPYAIDPLILAEDAPPPPRVGEIYVPGVFAAEPAAPPAGVVPEAAFPTAAAIDVLAAEAHAEAPGPDLAQRQEVAALLGFAPAVAADAVAFDAALAALQPPAAEPDPAPDPAPSGSAWPALDWEALSRDWGDLSRGWLLG